MTEIDRKPRSRARHRMESKRPPRAACSGAVGMGDADWDKPQIGIAKVRGTKSRPATFLAADSLKPQRKAFTLVVVTRSQFGTIFGFLTEFSTGPRSNALLARIP